MKSRLYIIFGCVLCLLFVGVAIVGFWAEAYENQAFPTFLFIASYDWLHNFYDYNSQQTGGSGQTDPDTNNFNKIIVVDSNLFPMMTSVAGDNEFPNITGRNTNSWNTNALSPFSPSVNDYFNRSIAVAPDYIPEERISYTIMSTVWSNKTGIFHVISSVRPTTRAIRQFGGRSFMQWAFITDPGNHNVRRYEFKKLGEFYSGFDGDFGVDLGANPGEDATSVCNNAIGAWAVSKTYLALGETGSGGCGKPWQAIDPTIRDVTLGTGCVGTCNAAAVPHGCYANPNLMWTCKHGDAPLNDGGKKETITGNYQNGGGSVDKTLSTAAALANYIAGGNYYDFLDLPIQTLPKQGVYSFPMTLCGNSRETSSDTFAIGVNTKNGDTRPANHTTTTYGTFAPAGDFYVITGWEKMINATANRDCMTYTLNLTDAYDLDPNEDGLQIRLRLYAMNQGGFVLDTITVGSNDSAFAVKQDPTSTAGPESRWNNLGQFLETVPPESYPGYPDYTSFATRNMGYGFQSNTSFAHALNVHFRDPRDIDVYRDFFDSQNGGPVYIFVADTLNSRIQVFMNGTGIGGATGAAFPIRPVRVKTSNDGALTEYVSNEVAMRLYSTITPGNTVIARLGDGRKADWNWYTTVMGTTLANSRIPADAGRGEFYFPQGVAVDQDPDTKDVYLFVADTFNHRIQIFRDTTGVTNWPILDKRFNFQYMDGWGSYAISDTTPGPYAFRYPRGVDVARFSNNSAFLYVVDSKDYRVLKYLIVEGGATDGIKDIQALAGYGYDGTKFVDTLLTNAGTPLSAHSSYKESQLAAVGFVNPQDVTTGYSGFYTYTGPPMSSDYYYEYQLPRDDCPAPCSGIQGLRFLNNYMVYVTDYARNNTTVGFNRMNMRVMQFADFPAGFQATANTAYLPWETEDVDLKPLPNIGQSVFGGPYPWRPATEQYGGVYNAQPSTSKSSTGVSENVPGVDGKFTDRPAGIAALTWNTVDPFDMRVFRCTNTNCTPPDVNLVYPNGTTISITANLRVGVTSRGFFGFPYYDPKTYMDYTSQKFNIDGRWINRVHVFCYKGGTGVDKGAFVGHTTIGVWDPLTSKRIPPYTFTPNSIGTAGSCTGYMKIIAEDRLFEYSGKTGTVLFRMGP